MHFATIQSLRVFRFTGDDVVTFLQGQLTTDIHQLTDVWQLAGYCSPKGRLLGLLYLVRINDDIHALVESSLADNLVQRLKMYVLRSKVTIDELPNAKVTALLEPHGTLGELSSFDEMPCIDFGFARLLIDLNGDFDAAKASDADQTAVKTNGESEWWSGLIEAGIPTITANSQDMFVPQMVNLDLLGGISFKKGCYTGQEIVARMHYLGKLKQRLFVCECESDSGWEVGQKILSAEGGNAGNVVSPMINQQGLAVIRLEHRDAALSLEDGSQVQISDPQPYPLEA